MSYLALARKWRPQTFSDIIGQETVVRTLKNAIEQNRIHHAYLFSGVRGVGKTTAARIFAKALNCINGPAAEPCNTCTACREITEGIDLDVREIDAATYTQVDNIRELREVSQFQPARDRQRIFIIDEAHMLSAGAWNALLKLIEEPPPHVAFIMATTEVQKVPATILSRVQSLVFQRVTQSEIGARLQTICLAEGIDVEPEAIEIIARRGEGSVRDSLSILDQVVAFCGRTVTAPDVTVVLGLSDAAFFVRLLGGITAGDPSGLLETLEEAAESGRDFKLLFRDFLNFLRNILVIGSGARESLVTSPPDERDLLREAARTVSYSETLRVLTLLLSDEEMVVRAEQQRLAVEISLLKAATLPRLRSIESLLAGNVTTAIPAASARARVEPAEVSQQSPRGDVIPVRSRPSAHDDVPGPRIERAENGQPDIADIVARLAKKSRLSASYLEQAHGMRVDGNLLTIEFDPSAQIAVEFLSEKEQAAVLTEVTSALFARTMKISFKSPASETAAVESKPASPITNDPVLQSLARHLGGEPVLGKGGSRTETS